MGAQEVTRGAEMEKERERERDRRKRARGRDAFTVKTEEK